MDRSRISRWYANGGIFSGGRGWYVSWSPSLLHGKVRGDGAQRVEEAEAIGLNTRRKILTPTSLCSPPFWNLFDETEQFFPRPPPALHVPLLRRRSRLFAFPLFPASDAATFAFFVFLLFEFIIRFMSSSSMATPLSSCHIVSFGVTASVIMRKVSSLRGVGHFVIKFGSLVPRWFMCCGRGEDDVHVECPKSKDLPSSTKVGST